MAYNLQVVPKKDAFLLVQQSGTICGVYATEKDALVAKPKIESNLTNFEQKGTLVFIKAKRARKRKSRQKSRSSRK